MIDNRWKNAHYAAMEHPRSEEERDIVNLLNSMIDLAESYVTVKERCGDDGVLGAALPSIVSAVSEVGSAILVLLNGERGRLDGGMVDGYVRKIVENVGINPDSF